MTTTSPFDSHHQRYEAWFDRHPAAYVSELLALRALLPWRGLGLEIGVGSARFAAPLGVGVGVDPSLAMLGYAKKRGIRAVKARAEHLPFASGAFDYALVVTTICFADDPLAMLCEARRVLRPGGSLVIGLVDRETALGQRYVTMRPSNVFYRQATFYSAAEVEGLLVRAGFGAMVWGQTLTQNLDDITVIEALQPGRGAGAFVVVRADAPAAAIDQPRRW